MTDHDQHAIRRMTDPCGGPCVELATAEALHRDCFCIAIDPAVVRDQLNVLLADSGTEVRLAETHAHLFSRVPIFVPQATVARMADAVRALSAVVATPAYIEAVLAWAPPIAAHDPGSPGGLIGFDFHLSPDGPRLIEINTNPGGVLLNALLAQAQRRCLPALSLPAAVEGAEAAAIDVLLAEWRLQAAPEAGELVVIVDESPEQQYLYVELVLYARRLEQRGYRTAICSPGDLRYVDGGLWLGAQRVAFVYNRLTDFALQEPASQALRLAYLDGAVAVSPHPRAHALWADKRNLSLLCQPLFLQGTGLTKTDQAVISDVVPSTEVVSAENRDALWKDRRQYFFKPAAGFGSRASYRGDKLTHKTWEQMRSTSYVAQAVVPPSQRHIASGDTPLKVDLRCYAYRGEALLFAARLYQGQTTNFRTAGGGFAPVLSLKEESAAGTAQNLGGSSI